MLNQAFPSFMKSPSNDSYTLDQQFQKTIISQNTSTNTGAESRLADIFTQEIEDQLQTLGVNKNYFNGKVIMDVCSGAGFLTYHLIKMGCKPKKITLCEISKDETDQAKKLLGNLDTEEIEIEFITKNILTHKTGVEVYDIVIGNSFLHHFYDIPEFAGAIWRILKKEGTFIGTHEPTYGALALEAGSIWLYLYYMIRGKNYINDLRHRGPTIKSNNLGDVWIFGPEKLKNVLVQSGFEVSIKCKSLFKLLLVTSYGLWPLLHINLHQEKRMKIREFGSKLDKKIEGLLPQRCFGELLFICKKVEKSIK